MINLIPKEEKKKIIKVFYFKLVILFLITAGVSIFASCVAILPSYFLSSVKVNIVNKKLEMQNQEPVPLPEEQTLKVIADLNKKIDLIEHSPVSKFIVSQKVINAVILKKMSSIKITSITYENEQTKDKKINLGGTASSRETLLLFRQALEDSTAFKQVDLPISNFIKGSNIQFYLSLIPA